MAIAAIVAMLAACGGNGQSSDTLDPLQGDPGDTGASVGTIAGPASTGPATVAPAEAGSGFVTMHVRVAGEGIDESLSLDRGSVRAADLAPLSLNATCTALDGGTSHTVSVIDLRRLGTDSRLVSATLRVDEEGIAAGEYEGTLELADTQQNTTAYDATVVLDEGGWSGTFEGTDDSGNVADGTFLCSAQPVAVTTTTIPADEGEEVPDSLSTEP